MKDKQEKTIPRLAALNDPTVLRINPTLAAKIGLNESMMLLQMDYLIGISTTEIKNGRPWTYQSIRELQEKYFPFWSKDTINRTLASLQSMRLIRCANFNAAKYDKTRWVSINYAKVAQLGCVAVLSQNATRSTQDATRSTENETHKTQNATRSMHIETTIPETSPETSPEISPQTQITIHTSREITEQLTEPFRLYNLHIRPADMVQLDYQIRRAIVSTSIEIVRDAILQVVSERTGPSPREKRYLPHMGSLLYDPEKLRGRAADYAPPVIAKAPEIDWDAETMRELENMTDSERAERFDWYYQNNLIPPQEAQKRWKHLLQTSKHLNQSSVA